MTEKKVGGRGGNGASNMFGFKTISGLTKFRSKIYLDQKKFEVQKNVGSIKVGLKKIGSNNLGITNFGSKKIGPGNF